MAADDLFYSIKSMLFLAALAKITVTVTGNLMV